MGRSITATNYGRFGKVTETLPTGFHYDSSNLEDSDVTELPGNMVEFTLLGRNVSFTYTATASITITPRDYEFSGTLRDSDRGDHQVISEGADSVTVQAATPTSTTPASTGGCGGGGVAIIQPQRPAVAPAAAASPTSTPRPTAVATAIPPTAVPTAMAMPEPTVAVMEEDKPTPVATAPAPLPTRRPAANEQVESPLAVVVHPGLALGVGGGYKSGDVVEHGHGDEELGQERNH